MVKMILLTSYNYSFHVNGHDPGSELLEVPIPYMFGLYSRNSHSFHVVNQGPNVHRAPPCGESEESRSSTVMKKMHSPESSPLLGGREGKFRLISMAF